MQLMIEMAVTLSVKAGLSGILSNKLKELKTIEIFFTFKRYLHYELTSHVKLHLWLMLNLH